MKIGHAAEAPRRTDERAEVREPAAMSVSPRGPRRRDVLALGIGAFVVVGIPMLRRARAVVTRRSVPVMGTIAEALVVHRSVRHAEGAIDAAFAELRQVERTMSRFDAASEIGTANRLAAQRPQPVSAATRDVLAAALSWAAASEGAFDPAIGRVVELWDVTRRHEPPPAPQVLQLAGRQLHRRVQLATEGGRPAVAFTAPDVLLDLGGIAKGYAVDRAVDALRAWGVRDALVNVGGDLYAMGAPPDGEGWRVGIQDAHDVSALAGMLVVRDRAVATSGDYEQGFRHRGARYHHLMDPETAAPRRTPVHSVTIEAASCIDADAAATAVFGMTSERARAVLAVRAHGARVVSWG